VNARRHGRVAIVRVAQRRAALDRSPRMTEVHGGTAPRFRGVRDAFARLFAEHGEVGAAVAVRHRGELVVDLWAGLADRDGGRPWQRDTAALVFSSTKGVTAVLLHVLAERGEIDLDAPVAAYWPDFAAEGKGALTVRDALAHRAGVPVVDRALTLEQVLAWDPVVEAIAAQRPVWPPGTRHGYHVRTYGWIAGELVRRVTGRRFGDAVARELAAPLALELWVGLPEAEEPRVATLLPPPPIADPKARALFDKLAGPGTLTGRALTGPSDLFHYDTMWNRRALRAAEMPSSNGIATARALATLYGALVSEVDGVRLLRPETVAAACHPRSEGPDAVLILPSRFGTGFMLPPTLSTAAPGGAFGHAGAGGSLGFADPAAQIGFGYVMNAMGSALTGDPRATSLVEAVYACLR